MTPNLGSMPIDLPKLMETRMLVQSNSGGGKSRTLRRILEQTSGLVQQIVIDPEGEFSTLRERFDYIVCAPHGADAVATPGTAAALAKALWKAGTSAILDIYELKAHERVHFVRVFLETLINAPRAMWHPTLLAIDEIHIFAPQTGQCESTGAVIDVATRGRKRGLCLLGGTQRLAKLHKDVAAELLNKLIGRTGLDVDVARAADELGMGRKEATEVLRNLDPGQFFAFGPALTRSVELTKVGDVLTTHPQTGNRALVAPPPASKAVLAQLSKLEGIQREAEADLRTVEELTKELAKVRRELTTARARPQVTSGITEQEAQRRVDDAVKAARPAAPPPTGLSKQAKAALEKIASGLQVLQAEAGAVSAVSAPKPVVSIVMPKPVALTFKPVADTTVRPAAAEQRVLDAIAWWDAAGVATPSRHQVAFVAGYTVNGHFNNVTGKLRGAGMVDYPGGGTLALTEAGRNAANTLSSKPTHEELINLVYGVLKAEPQRRVFGSLVAAAEPLSRAELAQRCGYTENGHFNNIVGALSGLGIAEYPAKGKVGLTDVFRSIT
jgi:hypothetical protein